MSDIKNFKDLNVWQESKQLAVDIYKLCRELPEAEKYGLTSQLQRCAVSIPSNIAEGHRRMGDKEFRHFLAISLGSAAELETQLYICSEVYNMDLTPYIEKSIIIQKMLNALRKTIK